MLRIAVFLLAPHTKLFAMSQKNFVTSINFVTFLLEVHAAGGTTMFQGIGERNFPSQVAFF